MDTLLAFIQDESEVKVSQMNYLIRIRISSILLSNGKIYFFSFEFQIYIYRDDKGFVEFASFDGQSPIKQMIHYEIATQPAQSACPESFLILTMDKHVDFMKAIFIGDCEFNENQKC